MASLVALPAGAQRTDDNAVTAASDAFGNTVGFQTIGLYSPTNARGFNPAQAENLRIEGLYVTVATYRCASNCRSKLVARLARISAVASLVMLPVLAYLYFSGAIGVALVTLGGEH